MFFNRIATGMHARSSVGGHAGKEGLIKLARQAMGEIDEDEAAKQARQRADDKAELIVHQEHVEVYYAFFLFCMFLMVGDIAQLACSCSCVLSACFFET